MRILMVCMGNICRSPLAEGILKHKAAEKGLKWRVDSAGTSGYHDGDPPDRRSVEIAQQHGIDITGIRGSKFKAYDLEEYDRIYVMDKHNFDDVARKANTREELAKINMIMNEAYPGENKDVPDPYYNTNGFEEVYQMLDAACQAIIDKVAK